MVIESMAAQGKEPTFCMGDDIPLAVLSQKPHMLYDYFKQRFAQVGYVVICSPGYFCKASAMSLDIHSFSSSTYCELCKMSNLYFFLSFRTSLFECMFAYLFE